MSEKELKKMKNKIKVAIHLFLAKDGELLSLSGGIHEQAISHRIALYLEPMFTNYNIDCEYNKHLDEPKRINVDNLRPDNHQECDCEACKKIAKDQILGIDERLFRPDILIHHRGTDEENHIAIEIKRGNNCPFDQAKLAALTSNNQDYNYKLGVFIYFPKGDPKYMWFVDGKEKKYEHRN